MSNRIKEPPATPEEIWAILDEITRKHDRFATATERACQRAEAERKAEREADRKRAEEYRKQEEEYRQRKEKENAEYRRQREQEKKEYEERFKKVEGIFTGHWGKLMESLVEGDLVNLLRERDINVYDTTMTHKRKYGPDQWQYDIVAHNGEEVVVVEVKTTMKVEDVHDFLYSLSKFRERLSAYRDKRIYGAMAYLRAEEESQVFAQRRGLFVIRATGDSASIINKSGFRPRQFD